MAVFRIEKTQNYTVMSNHHLRSKDLTLKVQKSSTFFMNSEGRVFSMGKPVFS